MALLGVRGSTSKDMERDQGAPSPLSLSLLPALRVCIRYMEEKELKKVPRGPLPISVLKRCGMSMHSVTPLLISISQGLAVPRKIEAFL